MKTILLTITAAVISVASCSPKASDGKMEVAEKEPNQPKEKIVKSEEEWKKILTPEQYRVARQAGTERAFNATYQQFKEQGDGNYYCVGCGTKLFSSKTKFDSGSGWPSFWDIVGDKNVVTKTDTSNGMTRVEVLCGNCEAHLGHLFEGEAYGNPKDKRYCINGIVLKFVPDADSEEEKQK